MKYINRFLRLNCVPDIIQVAGSNPCNEISEAMASYSRLADMFVRFNPDGSWFTEPSHADLTIHVNCPFSAAFFSFMGHESAAVNQRIDRFDRIPIFKFTQVNDYEKADYFDDYIDSFNGTIDLNINCDSVPLKTIKRVLNSIEFNLALVYGKSVPDLKSRKFTVVDSGRDWEITSGRSRYVLLRRA